MHLRRTKGLGNRTQGRETGVWGGLHRVRRRAFERLRPIAVSLADG